MFQAQCLHQNKSGNCVGYVCFVYQRCELFYTWKTRVCVTLHAKMFLWYPFEWLDAQQANRRETSRQADRKGYHEWLNSYRKLLAGWHWMAEELKKIFEQLLLILTHSQARKKLVNEGTTTIHVVKWVRSWKKNYLLLETQSKAKCLTMQIFNLHFALNFVKVSLLSVMRYICTMWLGKQLKNNNCCNSI